MKRGPALILATLILATGLTIGRNNSAAGRSPKKDQSYVTKLLISPPVEWPYETAQMIVGAMSERVLNYLSQQTYSTIGAYVARESSPRLHPRGYRANFVVASEPRGGSYIGMILMSTTGTTLVWDTLMPPSIIFPALEFIDLDGDPIGELVCRGQILENGLYEWAIVDWDSTGGHLMAPRLDQPGPHVMANRLIGRDLRFVDDTTTGVKQLELIDAPPVGVPTKEASAAAVGIRVFRYHPEIAGYLPEN